MTRLRAGGLFRVLFVALILVSAGCGGSTATTAPPSLDSTDRKERLRAVEEAARKYGGAKSTGGKP